MATWNVLAGTLLFAFAASAASVASPAALNSTADTCEAEKAYIEQWSQASKQWLKSTPWDNSCFVGSDQIDPDSVILVDTRTQSEFGQARIDSSVNLSPQALLNTPALKKSSLLVLNQGFRRSEMARLCAQARRRGFEDFRILEFGLAGWSASGMPVIGQPEDIRRLQEISIKDLVLEAQSSPVKILADTAILGLFQSVHIGSIDGMQFKPDQPVEAQYLELLKNTDSKDAVIVLADTSINSDQYPSSIQNLFLLRSTASEIRSELNRMSRIADRRLETPERYRCQGKG